MSNPIDNYNKIVTTVNSVTSDYSFEADANNLIVIDTSNNRIGINTVYPQCSIHISGGDVSAGIITPYLQMISGGEGVGSDFIPSENNTFALGSESKQWKDLYVVNINVSSNVDISNHLTVKGDASLNSNVDISNHLNVLGDVSLNSNVDINNHLNVFGDVSLNSNVDISNHLIVKGYAYATKLYVKENEQTLGLGNGDQDGWIFIYDFTGSHGNNNNFNFKVNLDYNGLIVSCIDQYINKDYSMKPKISESLPLTKLTNIENDKAVFGVIAYQPDANYNINNFKVNSLGEGAIWITNKNGNLEIGDYISSSTITGYGQKQILNEELLTRYTVAKITCNCDFSLTKQIKQKIITISNENYIIEEYKEIGSSKEKDVTQIINYDENGNIQYEDDLDLSGNQVYEYKFDTRFLDASANILIDEEDYLTRLNNGENVYIACFVGCTYHCG